MSKYYRDNGEYYFPEYGEGRTKQSFKDSCDVNKILNKMAKTGALSHLDKFGGEYGDFENIDLLEAQLRLQRGQEIFNELPAELKKEFNQSPAAFFEYVNKAGNDRAKLAKVFPELAEPGRQLPRPQHGFASTVESGSTPTGGTGSQENVAQEPTQGDTGAE